MLSFKHVAVASPRILVAVGGFIGNGDRVLGEKLVRYMRGQGIAVHMVMFSSSKMPEVYAAVSDHNPSLIVYCCSFASKRDGPQIPSVAVCEYDFSGYCQWDAADATYSLGLSSLGIMPPLENHPGRLSALMSVRDKRIQSVMADGDPASFLATQALFMCYSHYASDLPLYFFLGTAYLERGNARDICIIAPPMDADFISKLAVLDAAIQPYGVGRLVLTQFLENGEMTTTSHLITETGKSLRIVMMKMGLEDHERLTFAASSFAMSTGDQHSGVCLFWGKMMMYELFPHKAAYWTHMERLAHQVAPDKSNMISDVFAFSRSFCRPITETRSVTQGLSEMGLSQRAPCCGGAKVGQRAEAEVVWPEPLTLERLCRILDRIDDFPGKRLGDYVATHKSADKYLLPLLQGWSTRTMIAA